MTPARGSTQVRPLSDALAGCNVVIAVDRRASELAAALERHGARVQHAPAVTTVPHADDIALLAATADLITRPPDVVVVTTGVGLRGWMEAAEEAGVRDALHEALAPARFVARGPKALGAVQQAGFTATPGPETSDELGAMLVAGSRVAGQRVAVQHHGSGADGLDELLTGAGAEAVSLTVYRWGPPRDPEAVRGVVAATARGEVDAVLFTSAPGAAAWLALAGEEGVLGDLARLSRAGRLLAAAVGPVTAAPLVEAGIEPFVAERGRLGSLVRGVVGYFGAGDGRALRTSAGRLELRSTGALLDRRPVPLSPAGLAVLRELFAARGGVVARERLRADPTQSVHAVEMAVGRLREALGAPEVVRTVVKRGYRLDVLEGGEEPT